MFFFFGQTIVALVAAVGLGGCSNEFLTTYQGDRFSPPTNPLVVSAPPAGAGLIGSSSFVSGTGYGEPEAVSAASEVGADFVQWSRGLDNRDGPAGAGVVKSSLSPTGPVSAWAPVQPGGFLYRYVARYYKSGVKDSITAGSAAALPTGDDAAATQIIQDDQAATQSPK